jgi:hypothetical protein
MNAAESLRGEILAGANHELQKKLRSVSLRDAILFGRWKTYYWQKLGRFFVSKTSLAMLHFAELYILSSLFLNQRVFLFLIILFLQSVFSSFWWGSLDEFRAQVSELYFRGQVNKISRLSRELLKKTIVTCALILCLFGAIVAFEMVLRNAVWNVFLAAALAQCGSLCLRIVQQSVACCLPFSGNKFLSVGWFVVSRIDVGNSRCLECEFWHFNHSYFEFWKHCFF